jgi:hypothetical protein
MQRLLLILVLGSIHFCCLGQKPKRFSLASGGNLHYGAFQNAIVAEWLSPGVYRPYAVSRGTFSPVLNYQFGFRYHAWASRRWGLTLGTGQRSQGVNWQGAGPERWGVYYTELLARWRFAPGWYALGGPRTDLLNYQVGSYESGFLGGLAYRNLKRQPLWQGVLAVGRDFKLLRRDFFVELEYSHDFFNVARRLGPSASLIELDGPPSLKRRAWGLGLGWRF